MNKEVIKEQDEYLPVPPTEGFPAWINVTAGATINLGNFSSGKVSVSITYPCAPESVNEAYPKLKDWIDKRVEAEVLELRDAAGSNKVEI